MSKEIYISSTPHETRLAIVENDALAEIYYERENEYTLAGSIYNGKVTRVLPGMQSSFVDIGLERDAFLYITDFMEEAGDSADFDTAGNGDHAPRRDGRDRGNREAPTLEGTPVASPEDSGTRTGERSDRGRDRGGRGRRDRRSGNRDRQPGTEETTQPVEPAEADFGRHIAFTSEDTPGQANDGAEIGEGAPGADGSRRWRGRRGRRRGRGQRDETTQISSPETQSESAPNDAPDYGQDDSYDIDGAAEQPVSNATAPIADAYPAPSSQENNGPRDRSDRGGRDDRGRGDRKDRGGRGRDRDQRSPRVPRGFAPKTSLYGVDETPAYGETPASDGLAPEPIILPGESLSKYRKGGEEPAASASASAKSVDATVIIPQVASYAIPAGWDGGATLPGETLSRHRRTESRTEPRQEFRNHPQPQEPRAEVVHEADGVSVLPVPEEVAEALIPPAAEPVHVELVVPVEYEPTEASASYRVDPIAPSEFRQSSPVIEAPVEVQPESAAVETHEHVASSPVHSITPAPDEPVAELHTSQLEQPATLQYEKFDWQTKGAPETHQLTDIHATGEMVTEAPVTPQETSDLAAPIQHETAILNPVENSIEDGALTFAPGIGELEEETLDEEDFHTTLHASSIEELDDLDEETLEGAADLGTMLREMSIDQITSNGIEGEEDEDDLEEEDSIDDRSFGDITDEEDDLDETDESEDSLAGDEFADGAELTTTTDADQNGASQDRSREGDRGRGRRDGRRDGRRGERGRGDRIRHTGGAGDRERSGGRDRRGGRSSMQATNLPAISELLKPGQEIGRASCRERVSKQV